jgi:hypothetical protein
VKDLILIAIFRLIDVKVNLSISNLYRAYNSTATLANDLS